MGSGSVIANFGPGLLRIHGSKGSQLSYKQPDAGNPTAHARARYRCFLPDLAGLAGMRRAGPDA